MQITLADYTQDPEYVIGKYAAICYDSNLDRNACIRRAKGCVTKGHLATLRFAYATFQISGISRACSHQFVRSKHLDFLQESQRYVEATDVEYVVPPDFKHPFDEFQYRIMIRNSFKQYSDLIKNGMKKEDARLVLPNAACTKLVVTGNFQAWLDFLNLRSGKEVQWEIRGVANEIQRQLHTIAPNIFGEVNVN